MRALRVARIGCAALFGGLLFLVLGAITVDWLWPELIWGAPPPIVADLQFTGTNGGHIAGVFDARIQQRFPRGFSEQTMMKQLEKQGFRIRPEMGPGLTYTWGEIPCSHVLSVDWSADKAHRIVSASGMYDYRCI